MFARSAIPLIVLGLALTVCAGAVFAQDAQLCFATADRVTSGDKLEDQEKQAAHEACLRALADTGNVVQKYQLQEADFDIMGTRPKE
jgi:hypothetical protein